MKLLKTLLALTIALSSLSCRGKSSENIVDNKTTDSKTSNDKSKDFSQVSIEPLKDTDKKITSSDKVVESNNKFAFKIYSELLKKEGNIFFSPTSILFCLSMVYNGSDEKTKEEMEKVLNFSGSTLDEINKSNNTLMRQLANTDKGVRLDIANALFGNKSINFSNTFKENMSKFYRAEISALDFSSKDSVKVINEWVKNATQSKISKIIDSLSTDDLLVLINAIYFKGTWSKKFDKAETKTLPFKGGKTTKDVQMMTNYDEYKYFSSEGIQGIELPYGDEKMAMYIFLPGEGKGIADFNKEMSVDKLNEYVKKLRKGKGRITMPKFKLEYESSLNEPLSNIGMTDVFSDSANLSKLFEKNISSKLSQVKHKTFVEVNEEGTEAAAVTAGTVTATSIALPEEPFEMTVDSPFFYLILDKNTKTILFMGSILDL
ncbi:MAG: serpin family protein [Candidatus Sericytochromatia bacterium]